MSNKNEEKEIEINDKNINEKETSENINNETKHNDTKEELTLEEQLEVANKQIEQLKDKYLRTVAEFDNYKKRTLKEKTELVLNGSEKAVCAVLPILDDFERALANNTDDAQDFDVDFHEAAAMVPGMGDDKKGKVIDCLQTGYQLNEKVIRHAKVAVGQ